MGLRAKYNDLTFRVGDTLAVDYRLIEKDVVAGKAKREKKEEVRERIQTFEGICISIKGDSFENRSFTVRKIASGGLGIERIFPLSSPWIKNIAVKKQASVRRAKLYYLRYKTGKEAEKLKEKIIQKPKSVHKRTEAKKNPRKKA